MEKLSTSHFQTKKRASSFTFFGENWNYEEAFKEQLKTVDRVSKENKIYFLAGVHASVYTLGKSKKSQERANLNFVQTDRGGQLMYHGPGQLTLYPVFKLTEFFSGPRDYTKFIFDLCIKHFKDTHGLVLECRQNGLWYEDKKVGFLGLRVARGVVYHGLSLNYNVDLNAFKLHSPCDISGTQVGSCQTPYLKAMGGGVSTDIFFEAEAKALFESFLRALIH